MEVKIRTSFDDRVFHMINYGLLSVAAFLVFYPIYFVVIASFSHPDLIYNGEVILLPKGLTLDGYRRIFQDGTIWRGYLNSIIYTTVGTAINIVVTLMAAFALARKELPGRRIIMFLFVFTMYFEGGIVPRYLVVLRLGMIDTIWAMVLVEALAVWNLIIARSTYESTIPEALVDAATIDGCSYSQLFMRIYLPLSNALIAVMVIFYSVGHWNMYANALMYLNDEARFPLQLILRRILIQSEPSMDMLMDVESYLAKQKVTELIKYGVIVVSSIPVIIMYPFAQRYFVKGALIGSVKG